MTRLRCLDCQDGRHCRHPGYVPAGLFLQACRCLDCGLYAMNVESGLAALRSESLPRDVAATKGGRRNARRSLQSS